MYSYLDERVESALANSQMSDATERESGANANPRVE